MVKFIKIIILPIDNYKKMNLLFIFFYKSAAYSLYEKFINHIRYL